MVDRCVCCGSIIPEGSMVCINCQKRYLSEANPDDSNKPDDSDVTDSHKKQSVLNP